MPPTPQLPDPPRGAEALRTEGENNHTYTAPKQRAIIVDVDNTLIDTAIRKFSLLLALAPERSTGVTIENVRSDYELVRILGPTGSTQSENFFRELDTAQAIEKHPAPAVPSAKAALDELAHRDYAIVAVTSRGPALHDATLRELEAASLPVSRLLTVPDGVSREQVCEAKTHLLALLQSEYEIVSVIGDRPSDIFAARAHGIPAILLTTTVSPAEKTRLHDEPFELIANVPNWQNIPSLVEAIERGSPALNSLRQEMISNYTDFLKDLDAKANICVLISAALSAVSGQILHVHLVELKKHLAIFPILQTVLLSLAFGAAMFSLAYVIQAYTSRRTSGEHTGKPTRIVLKQWLGTFLGHPEAWIRDHLDAVHDNEALRQASVAAKTQAHVRFFFRRYHSIDSDIIKNLRMFELRAANYRKVYPERAASKVLRLAIFFMFLWMCMEGAEVVWNHANSGTVKVIPPSPGSSTPTPDQNGSSTSTRTGDSGPPAQVPGSTPGQAQTIKRPLAPGTSTPTPKQRVPSASTPTGELAPPAQLPGPSGLSQPRKAPIASPAES